jgi:hypothetical protein
MVGAFQVFFTGWIFIFLALCGIGIIALLVGALWMYGDAQSRRMDATLWLIFLIIATLIGTIVGFTIVFVLYLVIRESHPVGGGMPVGYGGYPPGYAPPATPPVPAACPVCGRPMMWYPQYQRWYCPTCGQYR